MSIVRRKGCGSFAVNFLPLSFTKISGIIVPLSQSTSVDGLQESLPCFRRVRGWHLSPPSLLRLYARALFLFGFEGFRKSESLPCFEWRFRCIGTKDAGTARVRNSQLEPLLAYYGQTFLHLGNCTLWFPAMHQYGNSSVSNAPAHKPCLPRAKTVFKYAYLLRCHLFVVSSAIHFVG